MLACVVITMQAFSQNTLTGRIINQDGSPLPGANIIISELNRGAISGETGNFTITRVKSGAYSLIISFLGYETILSEIEVSANEDLGTYTMKPSAIMGEEVIISAIRVNDHIPVSYSSISKEDIEERNNGQDIPYLLNMTPSLVATSDAGNGIGYTGLRIRGTDGNRINVTVNGIPLNDAESHSVYWVDLPDIASSVDNIQIQRGVGTSTNGAAAFGASINFQTKKLEKEPYADYEGSFGSFNTIRNTISAGTGLIKDHFATDVRLSALDSDGYIDRSWTKLRSYYLSTGYFDEKTILKFVTFSGMEELYQAWNGVPSYLLESNRTYNELGAYTDEYGDLRYYDNQIDHYKQDHYQLHFSRSLSEQVYFTSALHYTRGAGYYEEYKADQILSDYQMEDIITGSDTVTESNLIRRKWLTNDFYGGIASVHFRGYKLSLVAGGGWNRYDGDHFGTVIWSQYAGNNEIRHHWYDNRGLKSDWNSYVKGSFNPGPKISFFADIQVRGINYSIEGIDDDQRNISQEHDYLFFNPKAGINLQVDPYQQVYGIVARASREPNRSNFVDAPPTGPQPVQETLMDYELGYRFRSRYLEAEANLYYMDYTDQLVLTGEINDVGSAIMTNVKDSYRLGIELSAMARLNSKVKWGLNLTLSSNKILDYTGYVDNWDYWNDPENEPYQVEEYLGATDLSFSPAVILNNQFNVQPIKNLYLNLSSRYIGKQYIDNTSSESRKLDPYFVNDLRIGYEFYPQVPEKLSIYFSILNLLNAEYESNAWIYRYFEEGEEVFMDGYYPQAGIHFMAGLSIQF